MMTANAHAVGATERAVVAVFDFDNTLTDRHTFWRFLREVQGRWRFFLTVLRLLPTACALLLGRVTKRAAREKLVRLCVAGVPEPRIVELGCRFAESALPTWLRPEAMARLAWHQSQGHRTLLVSNSAEVYLLPWARAVGIERVAGSRFEARAGVLTGELEGGHCDGPEKLVRFESMIGAREGLDIHVYGDSLGDRELLLEADVPYWRTFAAGTSLPESWFEK
jgi:phosphatidylglycerophosphatase C